MAYSINDIKNMTRKRGTTSASSSNSDRYSVDDIKGMTGAPRRDVYSDYARMATQTPVQESKPSFRYNSYSEYENAINAVKPTGFDNAGYRAKGLWNSIADINRALPSLTPKWRDSVNQRKEYTDKEQEYADLTKEFELYKQDRGNVFREYNDRYKNNGDFAEKSQTLPAAINAATMDTFMQNQAKTSGNADSSNRIVAYNNMSDDEKALANYLANTDLKAFWKYMSDMNAIEDKEIYEQGVQRKKAAIDEEPLIGAYYTAEGMANKIANAPAIPVEYTFNAATGARQNPYSGAAGYANMGWDEQQLVSEKIREETGSDVLPFLYNTGVSIGESLLGAGTFGEGYSVLMGTSAFNNSYKELEERGASDAEIMTGALLAGAAETVFEKVSLENLLSPKDITSLPTLIRETLKQAGVEGSEELFTELSNIITDEISQGANSEINKMINEMRGNGVSEDEIKKTISDYIGRRIVESTLGGMLSGGAMGGVYNGANYAYNTEIGRNTNRAELASAIENMDRRSKTRRAYENAGRNLDNMKNAEVGAMAINALNEASSLDRDAYGNALVDNLVAAGLSKEDASKIKDAYFKQKRSKTEEGYFDNSVVAEAVEKTWNEKGVELLNKANENAKRIARTVTNKTGVAKLLKKSDLKVGARTELNGEEVRVKDVIKDGDTIKVVTENGEVNPKDLTLSANDAAMVVAASGIDNEVKRQAYFANYDGVQNVAEYTESFDTAYRYGRLGMSEEQLTEDLGKSIHLTAEQAVNAFVKGQNEANTTSEKLDESLKSATKELEGFRKGKLTFDNVDVKSLNATQRGAVVLAEAFNNMGINVVLFNDSSDDSENGRYENGTVYINLSARYYKNAIKFDKGYVINTMAHELTHWMEDTAKDEFKALKKAIFDFYGEEETKKLIAKEQQRQKSLSDTAAESEVVARACEDMLSNPDTLEKIMMGIDTNTRQTIIDKFKEFFEKLGRFLKNALLINSQSDAARMLRENAEVFEQVRQQWIKTFTEAVNNIQKNDVVAMAEDAILNDNQQEAIDLVGNVSETKLNSIKLDGDLAQASIEANKKYKNINPLVLNRALGLRKGVASSLEKLMMYLPEDIEGDIFSKNDSYGKSGEHSLICVRSLINRWFIERVANEVGRPLTAEEQIVASEILAGKVGNQRECQYCYVAADRRSYEADFGVYLKDVETAQERAVKERATVQKELDFLTKNYDRLVEITKESDRDKYLKTDEAKNIKGLVTFLRGRSFTRPMIDRYMHIISDTLNGKERLQGKHLTSESTRARYASDPVIGWYVKDATKYAKSASKAKLTGREVKINGTTYYLEYVAYNGNILEMSQNVIDTLNEEYGLRMYSYSDYVPAFILEDMQVITDAAVRGLKMLAYTKDLGFVRVFAPSGININISTYGVLDTEYKNDKALNEARAAYKANPNDKTRKAYLDLLNKYVISDAMQGAEWEDVKALRNKYENVGSVFVATSDDLVEWALAQDWIDTVIPYHTVFRGLETKEYFGYTNYKDYESDKKLKGWTKGKDLESIPPTIHGNSLEKYEKALAENHLSKRFAQWADNPNYMKLVNETRLSYSESQPVQPEFNYDEGEVEKELARIPFEGKYGLGNGFNTLEEQQNAFADDFENAVKLIKAGKTSKADIEKFMAGETLFSTKVDSEGRELTEEQQEFFADDHPIFRDVNGNLKRYYHGTRHGGFTVFEKSDDSYEKTGRPPMFFFTDNQKVAASYSGVTWVQNPDEPMTYDEVAALFEGYGIGDFISYEDKLYDGLYEYTLEEYPYADEDGVLHDGETVPFFSLEEAQEYFVDNYLSYEAEDETSQPSNYAGYIKGKNPLVVDGNRHIKEDNITAILAMSYGDKINVAYQTSQGTFDEDVSEKDFPEYAKKAFGEQADKAIEYVELLKKGKYESAGIKGAKVDSDFTSSWFEIPFNGKNYKTRDLAEYAHNNGYDSVVINNIIDIGGYGGTRDSSQVVITFDSNQFKSIYNENPTENPDIRYSSKVDSEGRELTEEQQKFFAESKVRDNDGNLLRVRHGTDSAFTIFNPRELGGQHGSAEGYGIYFSDDKEVTSRYGSNQLEGYLNIVKPAYSDKKTINETQLVRFIRATVNYEVNRWETSPEDTWISNFVDTSRVPLNDAFFKVADDILKNESNDKDIIQQIMIGMGIRNYKLAYEFYDVLTDTLGFDGFIVKWKHSDGESNVFVAFDSNQFKLADNLNPTEDSDIRYSLKDIGYHAGDLGKSESLGNHKGSNRGTGHFGTGTYFVGNEEKINIGNFAKRPHEVVDFSKYNLYRPLIEAEARELHDFLGDINHYAYYEEPSYKGYNFERAFDDFDYEADDLSIDEAYGRLKGLFRQWVLDEVIHDISEKGEDGFPVDYEFTKKTLKKYGVEKIINRIYEKRLHKSEADVAEEYRKFKNKFEWMAFQFRVPKETIEKVYEEVRKDVEDVEDSDYVMDSASTLFMKKLGYEGVDVRHIPSYDNTKYGSVIYDLKGEDLERKKEIGTARFSYKVDDETADIIGLNKALEEQNKKLKADVERLNKRLKLEKTITKGKVMKDSDLETVAGMLLREVKSKADKAEVIEGLRDVYGYILDKSNEGIVYDEMMSKAYDVAKLIMNEAKPAAIIDDYFKGIMEDIRRARVKLTPEQIQKAKYTYGNKWRNALMGRITTVNEGRSLDSYWQEWAEMYPNVFDVNTNPNDQLVELSQIYDDLKDASVTMQRFNTHADIMAMAEEVYDKFWNIRTETTTADKHDAEIKKLKFEHRKAMAEVKEQQSLLDDMYYGRKMAEYKRRDVKKDAEIVRLKKQYGKMIEKIRERSAKREADLKQFMKDRDARQKNNAERRKLISKITEVSEDLSKRLLKGEKGKKVPQALKAPLAELLTAIDYSSKQLLGINTIKKAGIETKRDIAMSALLNRVSLALQGFNDAKAEGDDAYDLAGLHLPPNYATSLQEIADTIAKVEQTAEGTYVLQYMTAEELNDLYKAIKAIRTAINNVNKIISTNNAHEVDYLGNEIMTDLDKLGQRKIDNAVTQFMSVANRTPYYFFKQMGRGGQELFSFLQNGWDKLADNVEVIKDFTRGKKKDGSDALYTSQEYEKWKNTVHEFDVLEAPTPEERAEGKEGRQRRITMTEAQIMALYCLSKREQAMGHISRDGIVIDEIKTKKKYGKHEIKKQDAVTLAPTDLGRILSVVTSDARMKQVSDKIQEFMNTVCAEWGNEVTMKLYGTEEFTEKNYFPIHVNQEVLSSEAKNKSHSIYGMLNQSFTKPLTEGARNEINIADIFDVFNAHASDMAKYNALALPIMDVIKVWNYKENLDRGDNGQREVKAVKKSITKAIGKAGNSYISGLLRDLNGDAESGRYDKTSMRLVKNYKTAAVAANIQTALLQPLAYIRAGYMVNPKYLRKALTRKPKINECIKDLGVQKWKSMGFYDTNLTRGLDKIISNSDNLFDTIVDKSLWLTEKMDEVTWGYLYTAVELETKDKYPSLSGEKLKEQTIKRLRDVVYGTQVFDSTLARTAMMRSTSALVQMETSFGAEPILSVNMLMDAATEFNQEARRTDFATAVSKKGKLLARASAVYLVASVVESALRAALKRIRDYDDEGDTFEGLTSDILERTLEELDVLNKIPWVKEAMPYIRKFVYKKLGFEEMSKSIYADNARMDTEVFATIDSAIKSIDKALEGENLTYKDVQKISQALSQTSGLPISNVIKEFKVVWNNTVGRITGNTIK